MIIKNNKPKGQYFRYKVGGKVLKYFIPGFTSIDILDLTNESQILSNTFERRLRHIEENFGYNFDTAFETPGDPDFPTFTIVASTSLSGTVSPLGSITVAKGENQIFSMTPAAIPFSISANTLGSSGGTISPSGSTVSSNAYYYLKTLTVDSRPNNQVSAVTGNVSATTLYTFTDVLTSHTISSTFALTTGSTTFTMTPNSNFYLNAFTLNGTNQLSGVSSSTSGVSTYNLTNIRTGNTINVLFKAFGL